MRDGRLGSGADSGVENPENGLRAYPQNTNHARRPVRRGEAVWLEARQDLSSCGDQSTTRIGYTRLWTKDQLPTICESHERS